MLEAIERHTTYEERMREFVSDRESQPIGEWAGALF